MTADWREQARRLARVTFLPGSFDKRFARDMARRAEDPEVGISARQQATLLRLLHRYRKQLAPRAGGTGLPGESMRGN